MLPVIPETLATMATAKNQDNKGDVRLSNNPSVACALDLLFKNYSEKNERDAKNLLIQELFEEGFIVKNPKGTKKLGSKKLFQALWRTASRMKPLDFTIHGAGRPEINERLVTAGVGTVMDNGGYASALRDKNGAFFKLLMYGDGFIQVGLPEDKVTKKGNTVMFRPVSDSNVYVDAYATAMRSPNNSSSVTKACVIFSYPYDEAKKMYPKLKGQGRIPRNNLEIKELERSYVQEAEIEDVTEIGHYYDLVADEYVIFGGRECVELAKYKGDKYPFKMDGESYIPLIQYSCMPAAEGFYNHGLGGMIYDLAVVSRRLMNMEINHIEDNVYPVTIVNTGQAKASEFFKKLKAAEEMRAAGKKGYVAMESQNGAVGVQAQSLITQNLVNEWQMIYDILDRELKRMGIFLDEADRSGNPTATQIVAEEESSNSFVKQIMEYNASESKIAVEIVMNLIETTTTAKDNTPLNITTKFDLGDGTQIKPDQATLGMVQDELAKNHYFVKVNARTGAIPSTVLQSAQLSRVMSATPPGTTAFYKQLKQLADLNDRDIPLEDFMPQQQAAPAGPEAPQEMEGGSMPSETDRLMIDPRKPQQAVAL